MVTCLDFEPSMSVHTIDSDTSHENELVSIDDIRTIYIDPSGNVAEIVLEDGDTLFSRDGWARFGEVVDIGLLPLANPQEIEEDISLSSGWGSHYSASSFIDRMAERHYQKCSHQPLVQTSWIWLTAVAVTFTGRQSIS